MLATRERESTCAVSKLLSISLFVFLFWLSPTLLAGWKNITNPNPPFSLTIHGGKVSVRNIRRLAVDMVKKAEKVLLCIQCCFTPMVITLL